MSSSYSVLNQKYNTLLALVLEGTGGSSQDLTSVLEQGNTTPETAIFQSSETIASVSGEQISISNLTGSNINTATQTLISQGTIFNSLSANKISMNDVSIGGTTKLVTLENSGDPFLKLENTDAFGLYRSTLDSSSLTYAFGVSPAISTVGVRMTSDGLTFKTNGRMNFEELPDGADGKVLSYSSGNAVWANPPASIVNGKISNPTYSATTPTLYSFLTPFTGTVPNVILTFDNGSSTSPTIIIVGLASVTLSGFYYLLSASPPVGSSLNWFATQ